MNSAATRVERSESRQPLRDETPRFVEVLRQPLDCHSTQTELANLTRRLINARQVIWLDVESIHHFEVNSNGTSNHAEDELEAVVCAKEALENASPVVESSGAVHGTSNVAIAVGDSGVLFCRLVANTAALPSLVAWLQMAAGYFVLAEGKPAAEKNEADSKESLQAYLRLIQAAIGGTNSSLALTAWCSRVQQLGNRSSVYLVSSRGLRRKFQLIAANDIEIVKSAPETSRLVRRLGEECRVATPELDGELHNQGACIDRNCEELANHLGVEEVQAVPLRDDDRKVFGVAILAGQKQTEDDRQKNGRLIQASSQAVRLRLPQQNTNSTSKTRSYAAQFSLGLIFVSAVVGLFLLPVPYRIRANHLLEPIEQRSVAAPFDGVFKTSDVHSGDSVDEGQLLGQFDDRDLRIELSKLEVERLRIEKQHEVYLTQQKIADAQLAQLRLNELAASTRLIRQKIERAELKSPISGVVLNGDLDNVLDASVAIGEVMYTIAPVDQLYAEIAVPAADATRLQVDQRVSVWIEGLSGSVDGRLARIHPASEIRDGQNVVVSEVIIDNQDGRLRPGMVGKASIDVGRKSIGYQLFHRSWERIRVYFN